MVGSTAPVIGKGEERAGVSQCSRLVGDHGFVRCSGEASSLDTTGMKKDCPTSIISVTVFCP